MTHPQKYLFVTEVGSRMWGMEQYASDYDLFFCYQQPAREYLRNGTFEKSRPAQKFTNTDRCYNSDLHISLPTGAEVDAQFMEIGHLVNLLKKGTVNAIWAVTSGVIRSDCLAMLKDNSALVQLRKITLNNLSKCSYHSIHGMATSQFMDAQRRKDVRDPQKSLWTCRRTLEWGHTLLTGGGVYFDYTRGTDEISESDCQRYFERLERAYGSSKLPEKINPKPFDDFLFSLRMREIMDNHIRTLVKL